MNEIIRYIVYIHAGFGGIGLIAGLFIFVLKKGNLLHKRIGNVFYYSMMTSCLISMIICFLPGKENIFLFLIGCLTVYLLLTGKRALRLRNTNNYVTKTDHLILISMVIAGILFLVLGIKQYLTNGDDVILLVFFGILSLVLTYTDWKFLKNYQQNRNSSLITHITRMAGSYIASITAFLVAGLHLDSIVFWIAPSIVGTILITYYVSKFSIQTKKRIVNEKI